MKCTAISSSARNPLPYRNASITARSTELTKTNTRCRAYFTNSGRSVRNISRMAASARYSRLSRISTNTSSGKRTTTSHAPSVNFATAKMPTTIVDRIAADRLIASRRRHPGSRCSQVVFGHPVTGHREPGEHADRENRDQRIDRTAHGDQQCHRERRERDDAVGEHQPVTAFGQLPRQEPVFGDETGQRRKTVETGIRPGEQDGGARRLDKDVENVADHAVTEDRAGNLRQHRRIFGDKRGGVGDVGQIGDTGQQEPRESRPWR